MLGPREVAGVLALLDISLLPLPQVAEVHQAHHRASHRRHLLTHVAEAQVSDGHAEVAGHVSRVVCV